MRISYTVYNFYEPKLINQEEFNVMKYNFSINPNYSPFPTDGVRDEFKTFFRVGYCGLAALGIGCIIKPLEWLTAIGILILFFMMMGPAHTVSSYSSYIRKRNKYYKKLKECIINSNDYTDFLKMFSKR